MKPNFLEKLLTRLDKVSPDQVQDILLRLLREKGFLEKVFEALQEGVFILEPKGRVTFMNRAAAGFFGLDAEVATGRSLTDLIPGLDWSTGTETGAFSRDLEVFYPENRYLNLYAAPIAEGTDTEPNRLGHVVLVRDITQTRRMTEEMIESERLSALTMLAAGVAHEIGNPLNSLNIHLQLLERKLKKRSPEAYDAVREQIDVARGEIKRLDFIVAQFLSAIRPSRPQLELEDLNQLIEEAVRFLEPEVKDRQIRLKLELHSSLPLLRVDGGQMKQAFYNLIKNACQATPPKGELFIRTDFNDFELLMTFSDNGGGISAANLGNLYQPFFTTKKSGTGLGLLIVRRIVREHGGELAIQSEEGKGTRITIHLPLGPKAPRRLGPPGE